MSVGSELGARTALVATTSAGLEADARRELSRVLRGAQVQSLVMKGNILALSDLPENEAVAAASGADTHCLGRILPVQRRVSIAKDTSCFADIAKVAVGIGRIGRGERFLVRCTRRGRHNWHGRELERAVAGEIARLNGAVGEYEGDVDWLVSVEVYQSLGFVGVNRPNQALHKTLRRLRKYPPGERPLNRAEWKIREALRGFGVALGPGARALDVGAAPGGWTAVLATLASRVVAVDPAELDPRVARLPNVRHIRASADDIGALACEGGFDIITCDMNLDPTEAAGIMCRLAPLLKPGAPAIMTVKYVTCQRRRHEAEARLKLSEAYRDIRLKRLPHNALETTAAMKRMPDAGNPGEDSQSRERKREGPWAGQSK